MPLARGVRIFSRLVGVAFTGLLSGMAAAQPPRNVDVDLAAAKGDAPIRMQVAPGEYFFVRVVNRAPGVTYRVTTDWSLDPERTSRPSERALHESYEFRVLSGPSKWGQNNPCQQLAKLEAELFPAPEETVVAANVRQMQEPSTLADCPAGDGRLRAIVQGTQSQLNMAYSQTPGDVLRVLIERLEPQTKEVVRRWRAEIIVPLPPRAWRYPTEDAWLVGETARDIAEMLLYAKSRKLPSDEALGFAIEKADGPAAGSPAYRVRLRTDAKGPEIAVTLAVGEHVWSPEIYQPLAEALLRRLAISRSKPSGASRAGALEALVDLRAPVIVREDRRVSQMLDRAMNDPTAHEQAALVVSALALREAAGSWSSSYLINRSAASFTDNRQLLCRIAAHLSLAKALRREAVPGPDGAMAEVALADLAGRQAEAVECLRTLEAANPPQGQRAWIRALKMRATGDWRSFGDPVQATLLESLEYYRALQEHVGPERAVAFLETRNDQALPDWGRISLSGVLSVPVGNLFAGDAIEQTIRESEEVWQQIHGASLAPERLVEALNQPASRCLVASRGEARATVLGWAAWASFLQRHLLHGLDASERHLRDMQGLPEDAEASRGAARTRFGQAALFPLLDARWSGEGACARSAELARTLPERLSASNWGAIRDWCSQERDNRALPSVREWLTYASPWGTAFDAKERLLIDDFSPPRARPSAPSQPGAQGQGTSGQTEREVVETAHRLAPYDRMVTLLYLERYPPKNLPGRGVPEAWGPLAEYDSNVMLIVADASEDCSERARFLQKAAVFNAVHYLTLGDALVICGREQEAVQAFEQGLREAADPVAVSNSLDWLADFYLDTGRKDDALRIAKQAADVGSEGGLFLMARMLERQAHFAEAESWYQRIAERYDDDWNVLSFYLRRGAGGRATEYAQKAEVARAKLFPSGFRRVTISDLGASAPGLDASVYISPWESMPPNKRDTLRQFGLREGDMVVAVNGVRVRNDDQAATARTLSDEPVLTAIVWRDGRYVEVRGRYPRPRYGPPR